MSPEAQDLIYKGPLDFRNGMWVVRLPERWEENPHPRLREAVVAVICLNMGRKE